MFWEGLLTELQMPTLRPPQIFSDSMAALGMVGRRGPKRLKHFELKTLVAQDWKKDKRCCVLKVASQDNVADILAKFVDATTLHRLAPRAGMW